jgi:hypothetical protein
MPANIQIIHARDFIRATADGWLDMRASKAVLADIAAASAPLDRYHVLLDTRKSHVTMTVTDLWYLAEEMARRREVFDGKTAVLCPTEGFDSAEFFALCAQNRGLRVQAFTSFEDAIEWLIAEWTQPGNEARP